MIMIYDRFVVKYCYCFFKGIKQVLFINWLTNLAVVS